MLHRQIAIVALVTLTATALFARQDAIDRPTIERIRQEGLERSKVMEFYSRFVTVDGPRLTGSPAHKAAAEWARQQFAAMGLQGAQLEPFEFGRGWELTRLTIEMVAPRYMPLVGYAEGWSAPTAGVIEASPVFIGDQTADQVEALKGTLKGAIVLTQPIQTGFVRADRAQPATSDSPVRIGAPPMPPTGRPQADQRRITEILRNAGAGALIRANAGEHGTMFVLGRDAGAAAQPSIVLAAEHYNMVARMLAAGLPVKLRVEIGARYLDADRNTYNVLAEIPGSDPKIKDEIVLVGGHLDSWHSSPGATDNADGAAAVLEAARILSAIGARPRRTIRFALWSGEEQGLLGSKAYATRHLDGPANAAAREKFNVYFNIDPGTGPVYGWYLQGQAELAPLFDAWLAPFKDIGARRNVSEPIGNTDHLSFTALGLPGFNPIQDYANYDVRTHHTNMDTFERVGEKDMAQSAVVFAAFAWHAAMRDEMIPRPRPAATR